MFLCSRQMHSKCLTDLLAVLVVLVIIWEATLCLAHACRSGMLPSSFNRGSCAVGESRGKIAWTGADLALDVFPPAAQAFKVESYSLEMILTGSWIKPNTFQPCLAHGMNHNSSLQKRFKFQRGNIRKQQLKRNTCSRMVF